MTRNSTDNWAAQYKSPHWQKKRLEVLERDNFTCNVCGSKDDQLNVHHIEYIYGNKVWEYDNNNFLTLCDKCHKRIHKLKDSIKTGIWYCSREIRDKSKNIKVLEYLDQILIILVTQCSEDCEYNSLTSLLDLFKSYQEETECERETNE